MSDGGWLVAGKVDQVQSYLLRSPMLSQIRGGSRLLVNVEESLRERLREMRLAVHCARGGTFLARADSEERAEQAARLIRESYGTHAPAARVRSGVGPWRDHDLHSTIQKALAGAGEPIGPAPDTPFVRSCDVCGVRSASGRVQVGPETLRVCDDCAARDHADRDGPPAKLLAIDEELRRQRLGTDRFAGGGKRRAPTTQHLAKARPPGYLGYLAADGNAIGEASQRVLTEAGPTGLARFSDALDDATCEAFIEAIGAVRTWLDDTGGGARSAVLPVLVGGDDVLAFTTPDIVLRLAVEFAERFEQATAGRAEPLGGSLTMGIGVVVTHVATPFGVVDEAAHTLQKRAKALVRADGAGDAGAVAFQVGHDRGGRGPEVIGSSGGPRSLGLGCYRAGDMRTLLDLAHRLKAADPPWSRLHRMPALLRNPDDEAAEREYGLLCNVPQMDTIRRILADALNVAGHTEPVSGSSLWQRDGDRLVSVLPDLLALAEVLA